MLLFVVNERAGNGRGRKIWASTERLLRRSGAAYRTLTCRDETEAAARTAALLREGGWQAVVAVGGDGSVHSLLPALAGTGIPFGLIPAGSGDDTARAFSIPRGSPARALETIFAGRTRRADIIATTTADGATTLTLTAAAVGLDAAVAADVNGSRYKRWCNRLGVGSLAYVVGLLRTLTVYAPRPVTVTVDGAERRFERCWMTTTANTPSYGGGLRISPAADCGDGRLDVCVVHGCGVWRLLALFPTILFGAHVKLRYVTVLRGRDIRIEARPPMPVYGDGEPCGSSPVRARVSAAGQLEILTMESG